MDDDVRLMHKRTNGELTPTEKLGFSRTKTGCWDSLLVTGIMPLKVGWFVCMVLDDRVKFNQFQSVKNLMNWLKTNGTACLDINIYIVYNFTTLWHFVVELL